MASLQALALIAALGAAPEPVAVRVLESFEADAALNAWVLREVTGELSTDHATAGKRAARLVYPKWQEGRTKWPAAILDFGRGGFTDRDWSRYDKLLFGVHNATDRPATLKLRLDDAKAARWTRAWQVPPKQPLTCEVPIADLAKTLDATNVVHFDLFMTRPANDFVLFIDHIRLAAYPLELRTAEFVDDPFRGGAVRVRCEWSRQARCTARITGRDGQVVATHERTASSLAWQWDGMIDGRPAPPGRYNASLRARSTAPAEGGVVERQLGGFDVLPDHERPPRITWVEPSTRKVMLHSRPVAGRTVKRWSDKTSEPHILPTIRIEMARNEVEAAQAVFLTRSRPQRFRFTIANLRDEQSGRRFPLERCAIYQVGYVETKHPSIYQVDHVGWWPDPLLPAQDMVAEPGECMPIWVSLRSTPDTQPGRYRGLITIRVDGKPAPALLPLEVRVHDVTLPSTTTVRTAFSTYNQMIARIYGHKELPRDLLRRYHEFIADHRINPDNIYRGEPPPIDDVEHFARRGQLNAFNLMYIRRSDKNHPYDEAHLKRIAAVLDPYVAELRRRKLVHLAYIYGFDEVRGDQWAALRRAFGFLKQRYPDIPLVTTARDPSFGIDSGLDDVVDIWTPLTPAYSLERAEAARARGKDVWWYICIGPRHPYANWFVEYSALEPRLLWWMTYQHRVPGFLYYTMSRWPLQREPMRLDGRNKTNWVAASYKTANGDGSLFCGGPDGPITTIRFENVRDGIEDHELLTLLARRLGDGGKAGRALCDELIPTLTTFTRDPAKFAAVRLRLLERLAQLAGKKKGQP